MTVKINDYGMLPDDTNLYLDGTDALVNASVNYLISEDEIEALEFLYNNRVMHDGSKEQISKSKKILKYWACRHKRNKKDRELIELTQKRIKSYNWNVYNKINESNAALVDVNNDYVAVDFSGICENSN